MKWIKLDSFSLKFKWTVHYFIIYYFIIYYFLLFIILFIIFHLVIDACVVHLRLKLFISCPPPPPPPPHNVKTCIVFYMYKKLKICFLFILQRIKIGHFLYQGIKIKMPTEQRPHRRGTCSAASSDGGTNTFMQRRFFLWWYVTCETPVVVVQLLYF